MEAFPFFGNIRGRPAANSRPGNAKGGKISPVDAFVVEVTVPGKRKAAAVRSSSPGSVGSNPGLNTGSGIRSVELGKMVR